MVHMYGPTQENPKPQQKVWNSQTYKIAALAASAKDQQINSLAFEPKAPQEW